MRFQAVAFDLDGTLYPNHNFYIQLIPFLLKENKYLKVFGNVRDRMRIEDAKRNELHAVNSREHLSFYKIQAQYMSEILGQDPDFLAAKTEKLIYRGWEPLFKKVKLFPHVREFLLLLHEKNVKLGLLSDFPPEEKLKNLGLSGIWDAVLCSEEIGRLKPDPLPFRELIRVMDTDPGKILYVGNSFRYDILGANRCGMKTAWIKPRRKRFFPGSGKDRTADFVFYSYRQLRDFMLV